MTYKEQLLKEIEGINEEQAKRLIKVIEEIHGEEGKREEKKQVKFGIYNLGVKGRLTSAHSTKILCNDKNTVT